MTLRFINQMFYACGLVLCACVAPGGVAAVGNAKNEVSAQNDPAARYPGKVIATIGAVAFRECEVSNVEHRRIVQCAEVSVPEDPENPDAESITLRVVRLVARDGNARAAPLLAIAGGPGQAASEAFLFLDRILRGVARDRDFYLVDQRGTGGSNPQRCDLGDEALMQVESDAEQIRAVTRQCLAGFNGDPTLYTTSVAIRDLERVRRALGVPRWHLFGVSYGTRVVQHYLRQHPQVVRTAVMDSVVPATEALGPEIALRSQQALDAFIARCEADTACRDAFPDISTGLSNLLARLGEASESVRFENMRTGGAETMRFTQAHLIGVLRLSLYQSEKLSTLPPMLHQAYAEANFIALARTAQAITEQMAESLAVGMHNSVVCTEDVPFFAMDKQKRSAIENSYMGDLVVRALEATCEVWPRGRMDEALRLPVTADVPVLLLSGDADPITPPAYAEAVLAHLPDARHLVAPGQGHFVSPRGCLPGVIAQFIGSDGAATLATDCLERMQPAPLFVNVNGPTP
ncbi:MAG: alpha/beta hydrolase [Chromatocurvus sp.]